MANSRVRFCQTNYGFLTLFQDGIVMELFDWVKDTSLLTNSAECELVHILHQIPLSLSIVEKLIRLEKVPDLIYINVYLSHRVFRVLALRIAIHSLAVNPQKFKHEVTLNLLKI